MRLTVTAALVQIYEFEDQEDGKTYRWNATRGRELAEGDGREFVPIRLADVGMTVRRILELCPTLDRRKALRLPGVALLSPILFVEHNGKHVLIDGWHRLFRAAAEGFPVLPAWILTQEEADRIRVE